jgi:prepilin-type N-terminal cleavage/methylation domain-containing protein
MIARVPSHSTDCGFTLAEICIAMALLALAAAGVAEMFGVAMKSTQAARVETSAAVLASKKLEQLRA